MIAFLVDCVFNDYLLAIIKDSTILMNLMNMFLF